MGGSSAPAETTQTSKVELSPEQKQLYSMILPTIEAYLQKPPMGPNTPFAVPRSSLSNMAETSLLGTVLSPGGASAMTGRLEGERMRNEASLGKLLDKSKTDRKRYLKR